MADEPRQATMSHQNGKKRTASKKLKKATKEVKVTMGNVVDKLVKRGWHYKPGRFEYDYFKPNVDLSTAIVGEDYFESESELETYLKMTGMWHDISQELQEEFTAAQERATH